MTEAAMDEKRYLEIIKQLGWSERGLALFFGITDRTQRRWKTNNSISRPVAMVLELMIAKKLKPEDVLRLTGMKAAEIKRIVDQLSDQRSSD
jgi:hypothetical protein